MNTDWWYGFLTGVAVCVTPFLVGYVAGRLFG